MSEVLEAPSEPTSVARNFGSINDRACAATIDGLILLPFHLIVWVATWSLSRDVHLFLVAFVGVIIRIVYSTTWLSRRQATLGMSVMKLHVEVEDGSKEISFSRSLYRATVYDAPGILGVLVGWSVVGSSVVGSLTLAWIIFGMWIPIARSTNKQAAQDKLARTVVLSSKVPSETKKPLSKLTFSCLYFGLASLTIFLAPVSIVVGLMALIQLKRHPENGGYSRAWFAVGMGVGCIVAVVLINIFQ